MEEGIILPLVNPWHYSRTDEGNAERFIDRHGLEVRYCKAFGWLVWNGMRWEKDCSHLVCQRWSETVRSIITEGNTLTMDDPQRQPYINYGLRCESTAKMTAVIPKIRDSAEIHAESTEFDSNPWLVACTNGITVDLQNWNVRASVREDFNTKQVAVPFDPNATCPLWRECVEQWIPDPEMRHYFKKAVGYSLSG